MGFLSLDGTFVVQLINFAIFFVLLNAIFLRPVGKAVRARREYINSITADSDRHHSQAASLRAQAEAIRAAARRDAEKELALARARTSNEVAEITTRFGQQAASAVQSAQSTVEAELERSRLEQPKAAQELASLMVERTLMDRT